MSLKSAGDIDIQQLDIVSSTGLTLDIRHLCLTINIYEDIFSPFITGSLVIKDALDLVNSFPLIGDETLHVKMATPGFTKAGTFIQNTFRIYKLSDREMMGDRCVSYILHFVSAEAMMDLNMKISRAYNDNIGVLAAKLLEEYSVKSNAERYHVEPTNNALAYVSNFWSPFKNLNYLADHALSLNDSPTFLFFENRNGLNFISLEALYNNESVREFSQDNFVRDFTHNGNIRNIEEDYSGIMDIVIPTAFNYMEKIQNGSYSSTLITHDVTTKNYMVRKFDVLENYTKDVRLNKYPYLTKTLMHTSNSAIATIHKANALMTGNHDWSNSKYFQRRRSLMNIAESCKVEITVLGRTDYTVGQKIKLKLYKKQAIDKQDVDIDDKVFSGYYIISSIRHKINNQLHECIFELIKDSFDINLNMGSI